MAYIGQSPKVKRIRYTPQSTIPANPAEGDLYYSDGTPSAEGLYLYKNGAWESVEGSGAGGINYIENSNAESALTGYATYDDGASSIPVDGSGGTASNITFSRNTSSPLRGIADFDFAKSAADAQGEGVSYDFTIDEADQASILRVSFDYNVSADYADADMGVFIYDVTNANLIRMSKEDIDATSLNGKFISEFQSAPDSTSYRLIFHVQSTNASAYDFNFDNVNVGPRSITRGPVVTDWESFTATGTWSTNTTYVGRKRRVGDSAELEYTIQLSGAPNSAALLIDMPPGLTINTSKLTDTSFQNRLGYASANDNGSGGLTIYPQYNSNSQIEITYDNGSGGFSGVSNVLPVTWANGDEITINVKVPISGWSSNNTISEDFGSRLIAVTASGNNGTSITANTTNIDWNVDTDLADAWSGSVFTAPESGYYNFSGCMLITSNLTGPAIFLYVNGSTAKRVNEVVGSTTFFTINSTVQYLNKGDTASFRIDDNCTLSNSTTNHFLSINKLQSPQTLIGSETVAARYTSSAGQSIPNATFTTVLYGNKTFDTHGSYNPSTGVYTFSKSGFYTLKQQIGFATINVTADQKINVGYLINSGTTQITGEYSCDATNTGIDITVGGSDTIQVSAGDTIEFQCSHGLGGATSLSTDPTRNYFSIIKN